MGLKGNYNYKGIQLTDAYARIDTTSSYDKHCSVSVNIYANQQAWQNKEGYIEQIYPIEFIKQLGSNVGDDKTQGYIYIKTLEQFKNWTDILEDGQL